MPHVIVTLWPGKSAEQQQRLSDVIANGVKAELGYGDDGVSVAFEESNQPPGPGRSTSRTFSANGTSSPSDRIMAARHRMN